METWKKILLRAAGFGAGFALTAAVIVGPFVWWSGRPPKPKPWNKTAISASFDTIDAEGEQNTLIVVYTLQNNTDADVRISDDSSLHLGALLIRSKSFSFDKSEFLSTDYPIYLPSKSRVRFKLHIKYPYAEKEDLNASADVLHDWVTKVCKYVTEEFGNLDGFVMLDELNRYEVDMPNGWVERGKEPLRVTASPGKLKPLTSGGVGHS
jgi:hypothetical protein